MSTPVRCSDCARVRHHAPGAGAWTDHPALIPGEVEVICVECLDERKRRARRITAVKDDELLRKRRRGYGSAPEGEDEFRGFRN